MTRKARIHIARPGMFRDAHGRTVTLDAARIAALAGSYDPIHKAPLVLGHPEMDAPAHGWVEALEIDEDGGLHAEVSQITPELAEAVRAGRYRNVSISWYPKGHQNSPNPATDLLRRVGILGAAVPAIRGLAPLSLAADEDGILAIEFNDRAWQGWWALKQGLRAMRDWFVEREGVENANRVVPEYLIDALDSAAEDAREPAPAFTDPSPNPEEEPPVSTGTKDTPPVDLAERIAELERREAEITAREEAEASRVKAARKTAAFAFADGLVAKGLLAPAGRDIIAEAHRRLAEDDAPISFSDGASRPPLAEFEKLFGSAAPVIDLAERSKADASTALEADPDSLARRAGAILKEDPALSFADAVRQAESEMAALGDIRQVTGEMLSGPIREMAAALNALDAGTVARWGEIAKHLGIAFAAWKGVQIGAGVVGAISDLRNLRRGRVGGAITGGLTAASGVAGALGDLKPQPVIVTNWPAGFGMGSGAKGSVARGTATGAAGGVLARVAPPLAVAAGTLYMGKDILETAREAEEREESFTAARERRLGIPEGLETPLGRLPNLPDPVSLLGEALTPLLGRLRTAGTGKTPAPEKAAPVIRSRLAEFGAGASAFRPVLPSPGIVTAPPASTAGAGLVERPPSLADISAGLTAFFPARPEAQDTAPSDPALLDAVRDVTDEVRSVGERIGDVERALKTRPLQHATPGSTGRLSVHP